jgi:UDP-galactopyranose mutase
MRIVGAGLSGAVIGRELALADLKAEIVDVRNHVASSCRKERGADIGVMVHVYEPPVFHTDEGKVMTVSRPSCPITTG